ncbi:hypothetical protein QLH51_08265 [Sphingomonas sp. 2R-10]|uniref:hypothetical protein n=1 Tax=Sphingomonas sp. 2R-10 TaxID=3045148 RepID=UPI0024BA6626|nr:hypothetical protein [Sphingomonas sp. 2R-10]MDJ0276787.1 hypothetical protein [Sphingomonas sp. 2R-10]
MNRLFRQDRLIASNTIRATFAGWHDQAIAAFMLLVVLAVAHAWFTDRPWRVAAWTALGAGTLIGIGAGRLVRARLAFHAFDGLLAADALHPHTRLRYRTAWHGIGLALLTVATLIVRPSLLVISVPAYLAGVLIAGLTGGVRMPKRLAGTARPGWTLRAWSHRPIAGVAAATVLLVLLLPTRTLGTNALMAVVGIGTVLLALILTSADDAIVRFMTIAGHGSRRIFVHHGKGIATFLAVSVPGCWIMLGPVAAGIAAAACVATLLLLALRVLAYRLHTKRFADFLVSILTGLLMLVAYSMPVALPVITLAMFWQLHRRGRTKTWLLV